MNKLNKVLQIFILFIFIINMTFCSNEKVKTFEYYVGEYGKVTVQYNEDIKNIEKIKINNTMNSGYIVILRVDEVFEINDNKLSKYINYIDELVSIDADATDEYIENNDYHEVRHKNKIIVEFDKESNIKNIKYTDSDNKGILVKYENKEEILKSKNDIIKEIVHMYNLCKGNSYECRVE